MQALLPPMRIGSVVFVRREGIENIDVGHAFRILL